VQFPLHEPYFDLTPIKNEHTKIIHYNMYILEYIYINLIINMYNIRIIKLIAHTFFGA